MPPDTAAKPGKAKPVKAKSMKVKGCPVCGKPVVAESKPFCSERCRDVDLGRWLSGSYVIPASEQDDETE